MKYRKKPVIIEAFKLTENVAYPDWLLDGVFEKGNVDFNSDGSVDIETLEGTMHASIGDYIIQGVNGEIYPCKPDIFEKTYERVD